MRKALSIIIALAMAFTGAVIGYTPAEAMPIDKEKTAAELKGKMPEKYKEGEAIVLLKSNRKLTERRAAAAAGAGDDIKVEQSWSFDEAVNPADELTDDDSNTIKRRMAPAGDVTNVLLVSSDKLSTEELIKKMKMRDDVEFAEPNYRISAMGLNDTYFKYQWGLENTGQNGGTAGKSTNAASKWDSGIKGSEKVVAVVDTGIDYMHEDLKDNIWENTYQPELRGEHGIDLINGDTDPADDNGHGTHCAGIIGASGNNSVGISGINQNVKLMALKILDESGEGYAAQEVGAYHYINKALDIGVNVVAINNSWGGGEGSKIFEKLVNIVGEKGAVTVCAAGNDSSDSDRYPEYPSGIESQYIINVAASNEKNELASFSNYGKKSVDIAAPGTDILSTVSYESYNPSIYDSKKQESISQRFSSFDKAGGSAEWDIDKIIADMSSSKGTNGCRITSEITDKEWFGADSTGKSLRLRFEGMDNGEIVSVRIPYSLKNEALDSDGMPHFSMMAKVNGPEGASESLFVITEVKAGAKLPSNILDLLFGSYPIVGVNVSGESNYWNHIEHHSIGYEDCPAQDREIVIMMLAGTSGTYEAYIDDMGMSKENVSGSFGKYDFYNGTSMAAPFVTGAVALADTYNMKTQGEGAVTDSVFNIATVLSWAGEKEGLPVISESCMDLSKTASPYPRIGMITVDTAKKQISIKGGSFGTAPEIMIDSSGKGDYAKAEVVKATDREIIIKDKNWINNIVNVKIKAASGKVAEREGVYLVNGKASYTELKDLSFPSEKCILATDGRKIYTADDESDTISVADTSARKNMSFDTLTVVNPEKYFKKDKESMANFDFSFGDDLVYLDGKLYSVSSYSETNGESYESDENDFSAGLLFFEDDYEYTGDSVAYSSQYRLMSYDTSSGKTVNLGKLPESVKRTEDWTLAAYNGKLYMIGGYDYAKKEVSCRVMVYNPATKKWTNGPKLPQGRAGGKALQAGNSLVYTMGYSSAQKGKPTDEQSCPENLILTGSSWKTSAKTFKPYYTHITVTRSGNKYRHYYGDIGLCASGIVYFGNPSAGLGDTFIYNIAKDSFTSTKYSHIRLDNGYEDFNGIIAGGTLYGFNSESKAYKASFKSGLVKVSAPSYKSGKIINANKGIMPGNKVKLTASAKKGYVLKSFTVGGSKVNGKTKTVRLTKNIKASAVFVKAVSAIKLNKTSVSLNAGESFKLKVSVTPKNAYNKNVTYTTSNKKYATVSSKGVITAKRAGKGKTVTITVKAKDGSGKTAKCKVKIK